jgi:hypothetical protein
MTVAVESLSGQQHACFALYPGKDAVPILQEAGWAPGSVSGVENLVPNEIRSRRVQFVAQSLYRLRHSANTTVYIIKKIEKRQEKLQEPIPKPCSRISLFLDTQADDSCARTKHARSQVLYAVLLQSCPRQKGEILMRRAQIKCWLPTRTWMNIVKNWWGR